MLKRKKESVLWMWCIFKINVKMRFSFEWRSDAMQYATKQFFDLMPTKLKYKKKGNENGCGNNLEQLIEFRWFAYNNELNILKLLPKKKIQIDYFLLLSCAFV